MIVFDDAADAFMKTRRGWVSRRDWDEFPLRDEWVWMPTVDSHCHPIMIICDGYGLVAWGASVTPDRDETTSERARLYTLEDLVNRIDEIETWVD